MLIVASVASMIEQFNMPNILLLQSMGYEVQVACNFKKGSTCSTEKIEELKKKLIELQVKSYQIDFSRSVASLLEHKKAYKQLDKIVKENRYAFIHCHSPIGGVIGRMVAHKCGVKIIYTAHGFHFYKGAPLKNWLLYYPVEKLCSRWTDVLITINKEDYALARKKMHAKKVEYVPGVGIDLSQFSMPCPDKQAKRKELQIPEDMVWILSVGELIERKNHRNLIKAVAQVENAVLTIAGKGELLEELKTLAKNLGVEKRVKFLGYRIDITELCESADLFAFPSYQEGLPVALMEAMASELPVICSNIRGNTDLVDVGKGGYLFSPGNVEEIIDSINKILKDNLKELGRYNKQKIVPFGLLEIIEKNKELYNSIGEV